MRYYKLESPRHDAPRAWSGQYRAEHKWGLPGVECPTCGETWSGWRPYSTVDLSSLPVSHELEVPRTEPYAEYARLAAAVRPLLPPDSPVEPGAQFGPLCGSARGKFGPLTAHPSWEFLVREDALERLQAAGIRELVPVRAELRGLRSNAPPLYELQLALGGRFDRSCIQEHGTPCTLCGWNESIVSPMPWLDEDSLPGDLDVFRVSNALTYVVVSERFVEVASSLEPSDVVFREFGTSAPPSR